MTDAQRWAAMLTREMPINLRVIRKGWPLRHRDPITRQAVRTATQTLRWMREDQQALSA